ncbi:proton-conducting transporter membrane subunit [Sphingomonas sp. BN140010]|uniref:Proton-conducting transporter membrane subunit n=1 Tax=Sphingomonas arvum TaxID=2992113 RepID=A0ABT3JCH7_9SPHN|nr:proton-conducting transporter membrane subunit [Sphingomonas sp. BN140010]MCW3796741.1 proton-conducting transporter membrane subunit [Sphingomonas sp. BN140010]
MTTVAMHDLPPSMTRGAMLTLGVGAVLLCGAALGFGGFDPVGLVLATLTLFITTVVLAFSERYMRADPRRGLFALEVAGFGLLTVLLAFPTDLITLGVAWIASGQLLVRLVGHLSNCKEAQLAAQRCRRSFIVGDAALLVAGAILALGTGHLRIASVVAAAADMPALLTYVVGALLVVAVAVRCALLPFHRWLLGSMSAPTPVSALMHGGFVNGGGFLLIRFAGLLDLVPAVQFGLIVLGTVSALYGGAVMLVRPDVKGALAGSTVSQMGFMLMTCGLGAYGAALWHLVAHGLFKASLFLGSGATIGMTDPRQAAVRRPTQAAVIALTTLAVAVAMAAQGTSNPALIPQLLALATALSTLSLVRSWRTWPYLVSAAALLSLGLAGAHAMGRLLPTEHAAFGSAMQFGVLAVLLAGWVGQRLMATRGLPPTAYVRLVNSGALHAR